MIEKHANDVELDFLEQDVIVEPPLYKVVLLNDDYTPMEFVVSLLQKFFYMDYERAVQVMRAVHENGKGLCGIFTKDVAETKCYLVGQYAIENQHPLKCDIEPDR